MKSRIIWALIGQAFLGVVQVVGLLIAYAFAIWLMVSVVAQAWSHGDGGEMIIAVGMSVAIALLMVAGFYVALLWLSDPYRRCVELLGRLEAAIYYPAR